MKTLSDRSSSDRQGNERVRGGFLQGVASSNSHASNPSVPSCSRLGAVERWPPMNARLCASCGSCLTVDSLWQDMARPQVSRWWKVTMTLRLNWMSHAHGFLSLMQRGQAKTCPCSAGRWGRSASTTLS